MSPRERLAMANDLFSLNGKVALVTGGSQGIGLMISRGLVEAGVKVYVSSRKKDVCDKIAAELSEIGEAVSLPADVSTEAEAKRVAAELTEKEGKLHVRSTTPVLRGVPRSPTTPTPHGKRSWP